MHIGSIPTRIDAITPTTSIVNITDTDITGRDVVLINPFLNGGGDIALGNRVANIALHQGCRVVIIKCEVGWRYPKNNTHRSLSLQQVDFDIASLKDPVFIVSPVGIFEVKFLNKLLAELCDQFQFIKKDAILIEEMDLLQFEEYDLQRRKDCLENMGFKTVTLCKLGFGEGAIGYLPVDEQTLVTIKARFKVELERLMDSFNLTLDKRNNYHLAYVSSTRYCWEVAKCFVFNSLVETMGERKDSNYIIVVRNFDHYNKVILDEMKKILEINETDFGPGYDAAALFAYMRIFQIEEDGCGLRDVAQIFGKGRRHVNIGFCKNLPQNIFQDFIAISRSGMASGDQSLSEFLSISQEMPYYEMQPWKLPLVQSLSNRAEVIAEQMKVEDLNPWIAGRFFGYIPEERSFIHALTPNLAATNHSKELDEAKTEFHKTLTRYSAEALIIEKLRKTE